MPDGIDTFEAVFWGTFAVTCLLLFIVRPIVTYRRESQAYTRLHPDHCGGYSGRDGFTHCRHYTTWTEPAPDCKWGTKWHHLKQAGCCRCTWLGDPLVVDITTGKEPEA